MLYLFLSYVYFFILQESCTNKTLPGTVITIEKYVTVTFLIYEIIILLYIGIFN